MLYLNQICPFRDNYVQGLLISLKDRKILIGSGLPQLGSASELLKEPFNERKLINNQLYLFIAPMTPKLRPWMCLEQASKAALSIWNLDDLAKTSYPVRWIIVNEL